MKTQNVELFFFLFYFFTSQKKNNKKKRDQELVGRFDHLLIHQCIYYYCVQITGQISCFRDMLHFLSFFFLLFAVRSVKISKSIRQNNKN